MTAVVTRRDLGVDDAFLRQPWKQARDVEGRRPSCWDLAASAAAGGWQGLRVPSVQAPGTNLVLWHWNEPEGALVRHLDPLNDLPQDQTSPTASGDLPIPEGEGFAFVVEQPVVGSRIAGANAAKTKSIQHGPVLGFRRQARQGAL